MDLKRELKFKMINNNVVNDVEITKYAPQK